MGSDMIMKMPLRLLSLICAMVLYGVLGSPTPDAPGWVEALVGAMLVVAVAPAGLKEALYVSKEHSPSRFVSQALFIFALSVPVMIGVMSGHDFNNILRDVLPFLFMMLPLFLGSLFRTYPEYGLLFVYVAAFMGLCFALRALMPGSDPLHYFANMPSVLMAAILCAGLAISTFVQRFSVRCLGGVLLLIVLSGLALWPMIEVSQRASLAAYLVALFVIMLNVFRSHPRRAFLALVPVLACLAYFWSDVLAVWDVMAQKQKLVGLNMRIEEWGAVWNALSDSPLYIVAGKGWGASLQSPAVAGITVQYTHSLLSYMALKTGLIGMILTGLYIFAHIKSLISLSTDWLVIFLALALPVMIDVFLYASFKSLDFGIVLMLFPAVIHYQQMKERAKIEKA